MVEAGHLAEAEIEKLKKEVQASWKMRRNSLCKARSRPWRRLGTHELQRHHEVLI